MKTKKIDPDNLPVSRHCMKKLAEIVGPLVVIMIVAQITTTFFIVKYLPENADNIPASLITELDEIHEHIESLDAAQEANLRESERTETVEETTTPAPTTIYVPATTTPEPEPEPETTQDPVVEEPVVEEAAKDTGGHADSNSSNGLVRVHDALCPSGYAMMNARLEKTCE